MGFSDYIKGAIKGANWLVEALAIKRMILHWKFPLLNCSGFFVTPFHICGQGASKDM